MIYFEMRALLALHLVWLCASCWADCVAVGQEATSGPIAVESVEKIMSTEGEVPVDYQANGARVKLPEQMDDGELEGGDHHIDWNYLDQKSWTSEYPQCSGVNMRQSPVDILTDRVVFNERLKLDLIDYNQEVEFEFKNTHHSVSLTPIALLGTPALRLNWVGGKKSLTKNGQTNSSKRDGAAEDEEEEIYELQEIHFHWGDGINKGSEHEINGQRTAAEMHMVHYRRGLDKSQIGNVENSVVVLAVLIESDAVEHNKLEGLVHRTGVVNGTDIQYKDTNPENLINLLPDNHSFYTYNGSLTTPPCYEVVTWIILSEPVFMSQERLVELSNLQTNKGPGGPQKISSNYRDIQPLLERPVYASFNASDTSTYELTSEFQMKRIGGQHSRFSKAIDEYWQGVNELRVSVKQAYRALDMARRKLVSRLGIRMTRKKTATAADATGGANEQPQGNSKAKMGQ